MTTTTNYVQRIVDRLAAEFPGKDPALLRLYALLVFATGTATTEREVHDAWALWRSALNPDNPALVPFEQLTPAQIERDRKYVVAIRAAAREVTR